MSFMAISTIAQKLTAGLANIGKASLALATVTVMGMAMTQDADAAAMRRDLTYSTLNTLAANDDGSTGSVAIGFTTNFFGLNFNSLYVNNNGNVTFDNPLFTYTPFNLTTTGAQIIAPFFGDVDTRPSGSQQVTYGQTTVGGRNAFAVNWDNVGYFSYGTDRLNQFQLVMIDRSDTGAGNFDFEFNYDQVQWETGDASGGSGGLGGSSARAGFSNGTGNPGSFFELAGSAVNGAFLDGGPASTRLIGNRLNSNVDGRYVFSARNGTIQTSVPEPSTVLGMLAIGALSAGTLQKRKQQQKANG
jgi:Nidogen-like/PEP-CTERM motif